MLKSILKRRSDYHQLIFRRLKKTYRKLNEGRLWNSLVICSPDEALRNPGDETPDSTALHPGYVTEATQKTARKNYELIKNNPKHPSLHFKKVDQFWSARVGIHYRALAIEDDGGFIWVWIGAHEEYDRLIR